MKRVLVTGGLGFVGRHLVARLIGENCDVDVVVRKESRRKTPPSWRGCVTCHEWDESTQGLMDILAQSKPDLVFHVASNFVAEHTPQQVEAIIQSNVVFGTQLLESMVAANVHNLINFGTSWQHYKNQSYSPVCLYAATKQAFEAILQFYVESAGLRVITLKLFDTFGPDDDRGKLFSALMRIAKSGEVLNLSPGEQQVDFVYIDDVIDAAFLAADRLMTKVDSGMESYGVSSGAPLSLRNFIETVSRVIGKPLNVVWGARPYRAREVMELWTDFAPLPGWTAKYSLETGIRHTADSYV